MLAAQGMRPAAYRTPITGATSTTITDCDRRRRGQLLAVLGRRTRDRALRRPRRPSRHRLSVGRAHDAGGLPRTVKVLAVASGEYWTRPQELLARAHAQVHSTGVRGAGGCVRSLTRCSGGTNIGGSSGRTTSSPRSPGRWTVCSRRRAGWYGRIERGPRLLGAPVAGTHRSRRQARDRFPR